MNKYLAIAAVLALVMIAIYVGKRDDAPVVQLRLNQQATPVEQVLSANSAASSSVEKSLYVPQPQALAVGQSSATNAEQTQNAVDFNAPGAGTAQQKAGAAAAATKAYQESKH